MASGAENNAIARVAATLCRPEWPAFRTNATDKSGPLSKTEAIRRLLRTAGPMTSARICLEVDLPNTGRVSALLKADLRCGRVALRCGRFEWNRNYDEALAVDLQDAVRLLRRHGYKVAAPRVPTECSL